MTETLRSKLLRVAHEQPVSRRLLVPLLRKHSALPKPNDEVVRNEVLKALKAYAPKKRRSLSGALELEIRGAELDVVAAAVEGMPKYRKLKEHQGLVELATSLPSRWQGKPAETIAVTISQPFPGLPVIVSIKNRYDAL